MLRAIVNHPLLNSLESLSPMLILLIIALFCSVVLVAWLATRFLIAYLIRSSMVDVPNERTLHQGSVPRGGGIVMVVTAALGLFGVGVWTDSLLFYGILAGLLSAWGILGWYDDRHDLSPKIRFIVQFCLALLTVAAFGWVNQIGWLYLGWFGAVVSVLGILWMANLYNFMDGMDGLAASQSIIASITLAFWFYMANNLALAVVCGLVAASSYGFLLWNWRPAKVFMGDVGSVTLGAFFATMIIIAVTRHDYPVLSLVLIFAVFVSDASVTIARRIWHREKIWLPHRTHYYQRLATHGVSHAKIVCGAIIMMLICSLIATLSVLYRDTIALAIFGVVSIMVVAVVIVKIIEAGALPASKPQNKTD
ncbi:glycosyltransferase family 4 protein [Arenicella xantha]|uniref:Fuc2NAc and GlcNAc transferase n=1 Tax=Arenicella xantha TaxID=644221 RepID=A0A395JF82_9GAMM|nr:glycosyltransferase family 4 protein [Arenicella xantha]RBP48442.1 Fuc2NAc and GlcNAc transferase [Arenicella xantha]